MTSRESIGIQLWSTRQKLVSVEKLISSGPVATESGRTRVDRTAGARIFSLFDRIKNITHDHLCSYYDLVPCLQSEHRPLLSKNTL